MLFNNLLTERRASIIVKNSAFYIEIAKFVQAYTTIVKNPNEFLKEIGENPIDIKTEHLNWEQLVKIMQTCELGFGFVPSRTDLAVYYNYALEIGSVKALRKIASVDEVAEAQKHYYNFVDEAKTNAEEALSKQKKVVDARQREIDYVDGKISNFKTKNWFCLVMMIFSMAIAIFGVASLLADNIVVDFVGKIIPFWKPQFIGSIIFIVIALLLFGLFNKGYTNSKRDYVKLINASITIFARGEEVRAKEEVLKKKFDEIQRDYLVVQAEIHDKTKKYDVKNNIDKLKKTNKYYQQLCDLDEDLSQAISSKQFSEEDDFAPVKLTKEQEENMHSAKKEAIGLSGQIDMDAYYSKFEKSKKDLNKKKEKTEEEILQEEQEKKEKLLNSVEEAKEILGLNVNNSKEQEK